MQDECSKLNMNLQWINLLIRILGETVHDYSEEISGDHNRL